MRELFAVAGPLEGGNIEGKGERQSVRRVRGARVEDQGVAT